MATDPVISELVIAQMVLAVAVCFVFFLFGISTPIIMAGGISVGLWLAAGWIWMREQ